MFVRAQPKDAVEILAGQLEVAGIVKVTQRRGVRLERLWNDRRLRVNLAVRHTRGVGKPKRIDLYGEQATPAELVENVLDQGPPNGHLRHIDAVQRAQVFGWVLEESPLVAFEVSTQCARARGYRVEIEAVQDLDPQIEVAVGLGPCAIDAVQSVRLKRRQRHRFERDSRPGHPAKSACPDACHHDQSRPRSGAGHRAESRPCVWSRASAMRSIPKPTHALCATAPSAVLMAKF